MTVTVSANDAPVAEPDTMTAKGVDAGFEPIPAVVPPLRNDSDRNGDDLEISAFTQGANGAVTCFRPLSGPWACGYRAAPGFVGIDTFTYTVDDGHGGQDVGTVTVTVLANTGPDAVDDVVFAHRGGPVPGGGEQHLHVLANDTDPTDDDLVVASHTQPLQGTVAVLPGGDLVYTPPAAYNGPYPLVATFTYTVGDQRGGTDTATVTIRLVDNRAPVARDDTATAGFLKAATINVLANDDDPDGDSSGSSAWKPTVEGVVSCGVDRCTYRAPAGKFPTETFEYTVDDGHGRRATAKATVTVVQNRAPKRSTTPSTRPRSRTLSSRRR